MKIAFFEIRDEEKKLLEELLSGHELTFNNERLSAETTHMIQNTEVISVFVNSTVDKSVIDSLVGVKFITTRATGFDNIDIEYAKSKGITVSNVPGYGATTVAEFTFALLLNLSRKIILANQRVRTNKNYDINGLRGFDLAGKTMGIIGTGKIGKNVIKIAKGFGMNIVAMDAFPDEKFASEAGYKYVGLHELLSTSDIISLHAPLNKDTLHLLNAGNLPLVKKGAYILNTARGELIETSYLVAALQDGRIAGAALDVIEGEKIPNESYKIISDMPNVIVTPHIAFYSKEAEAEIVKVTADNITKFIEGNPQNIVN